MSRKGLMYRRCAILKKPEICEGGSVIYRGMYLCATLAMSPTCGAWCLVFAYRLRRATTFEILRMPA